MKLTRYRDLTNHSKYTCKFFMQLWIPFIVFSNTENQESTKGDDESEVTITREGNFTESGVQVMEEINIFEGGKNRITFQQVYSKTLKCVYQLQLYPFDTQVSIE